MNAQEEARLALNSLFVVCDEAVARDASQKIKAALDEKDEQIAKLQKSFDHSGEANKAWLAEFDHHKQRLAEARGLIQKFGTVASDDSNVIRAAEVWLRGRP